MPNWLEKAQRPQLYTKNHGEQRKAGWGRGGRLQGRAPQLLSDTKSSALETHIQITEQTEQVTLRNIYAYRRDQWEGESDGEGEGR